jgi:hypothetical protein
MILLNERQAPSEVRFENTFISAVHAVPERDATAVHYPRSNLVSEPSNPSAVSGLAQHVR